MESEKSSAPRAPIPVGGNFPIMSRTPSMTKRPVKTSTVVQSAPSRASQSHSTPSLRQQSQRSIPHPTPQSTKLAVVLTSPSKSHGAQLASSHTPIQRTIPQLWELSKSASRTTPARIEQVDGPQPSQNSPKLLPSAASTPLSSTKGRPKGWKPGMSYSVMRGRPPPDKKSPRSPRQPRKARVNAPPLVWSRRAGRPARTPSPTPRELYYKGNADFLPFLCEWRECKAELHNVDTLRKHVHVAHGHSIMPQTCQWADCAGHTFPHDLDWRTHMEEAHFTPFAWHMGDGPRNTSDVLSGLPDGAAQEEVPDYLRGPDGQQVTPSIKNQELEDFTTWRENRRKLKELLILRDQNLPDSSSEVSDDV